MIFFKENAKAIIGVLFIVIIFPIIILTPSPIGFIPHDTGLTIIGYGGSILGGFLTLYGVWWTIKDQNQKSEIVSTNENIPIIKYDISTTPLIHDSTNNFGAIGKNVSSVKDIELLLTNETYNSQNMLFPKSIEITLTNLNPKPITLINVECSETFYNLNVHPYKKSEINKLLKIYDSNHGVFNFRFMHNNPTNIKLNVFLSKKLYSILKQEIESYFTIMVTFSYKTDFNKIYKQNITILVNYECSDNYLNYEPSITAIHGLEIT
jgi:hypothetical protein